MSLERKKLAVISDLVGMLRGEIQQQSDQDRQVPLFERMELFQRQLVRINGLVEDIATALIGEEQAFDDSEEHESKIRLFIENEEEGIRRIWSPDLPHDQQIEITEIWYPTHEAAKDYRKDPGDYQFITFCDDTIAIPRSVGQAVMARPSDNALIPALDEAIERFRGG